MINQNSQFFAILTNVGVAKQVNADALGVPWKIAQMGVGDANDTDPIPSATQTKLINERRRAPLNQLKVDPANSAIIIAEQVIPAEVGGFWIREIALYDTDGDMVAVANCAPSFKPLLTQGSGRTQVVRLNMQVSNSSNVELKIDPSVVLATRAYVDTVFSSIIDVYAQASAYDGTPRKLMKVGAFGWGSSYGSGPLLLNDMTGEQTTFSGLYRYSPETLGHPAFGSGYGSILQGSLSDAGGNWATQLIIDYAADAIGFRRLSGVAGWKPFLEIWHAGNLKAATQEQANSGADDATFLTPKKFSAALAALIIQATETIKGIARVATQPQTNSGVDDATFVTPKKFSAGIAALVVQATEAIVGIARVATQLQTDAGADDATFVTPKKMRWGFQILKAARGYIALPSWLGGFIIQWGAESIAATTTNISFPLTYPNACLSVTATAQNATGSADVIEINGAMTRLLFPVVIVSSGSTGSPGQVAGGFYWISVGY
ncbi:phage tail-collar fiber domain-containing protein [Pseudomonas sp. GG8]